MRKMQNWVINKRIYNINRNANLVMLGALLDIETFNKIQKIKEQKGINNIEYILECYNLVKKEYEGIEETNSDEGIDSEYDPHDIYLDKINNII